MTDTLLTANSLIQQGIDDLQRGHVEAAISLFTAALQHESSSVYAYANRATAYYAQGSYHQALNDFSRALELAPTLFALYVNRGLTYHKLGDIDRFITDFEQAIRLDHQHFIHHFEQAIMLSPKESQGVTNSSQAQASSLSYNLIGVSRKELHQAILKILSAFSELCSDIKIQSNDFTTRKVHTDVLKLTILLYNQAIAADPNNSSLYWDRSCLLSDSQQYDQAISDLNQALRLSPASSVLWLNRGIVHYKLFDLASALADFSKALELSPGSADIYANRAVILIGLQRFEEAILDLDRAIQIAPNNMLLVRLRETIRS